MIRMVQPREAHQNKHISATIWPKSLPVLTPEMQEIREDFMRCWLEVLPNRYGLIERFNHGYPLSQRSSVHGKTLEVGAGTGAHLAFEDLSQQDYTALELRAELAQQISLRYPRVHVIVGDIQEHIDAPDGSFDHVIAIHVLEHLPNLPAALKEIRRVMKAEAVFSTVIPCEGGAAYRIARNLSTRRLFEKRYKCSYDWFVQTEHVNNVWEMLGELGRHFRITQKSYWPFRVPSVHFNLVIGLTCVL